VGLIGGGDAGFGEALRWPATRLPALDEAVA
jgi:hypothetical protein